MTVIIRILLFPLFVKQIRSMRAMQELQPRQERRKNIRTIRSKCSWKWRKCTGGANLFPGCLPMLIQMPVLISIFYALREYQYNPEHVTFLWLPSLNAGSDLCFTGIGGAHHVPHETDDAGSSASGVMAQQQKIMAVFMQTLSVISV